MKPRRLEDAVSPLLEALRWEGTPRQLADAMPAANRTLRLTELRNLFAALGYGSSVQRMRMQSITPLRLPALFVPTGIGPALVLQSKTADGWVAHRVGEGRMEHFSCQPGLWHRGHFRAA